jgi:hypothetical protein
LVVWHGRCRFGWLARTIELTTQQDETETLDFRRCHLDIHPD